VGAEPGGGGGAESAFAGQIDELRISGSARYRNDGFTPALRHATDSDTVLLLHFDGQEPPFAIDATPAGGHGLLVGGAHFIPVGPTEIGSP